MATQTTTFDVLIVGAGAAGLAAAAMLSRSGRSVCILEARDRIGGRIHTCHDPGAGIPLELGAEFIHGMAPATIRWLRQSNTPAVDVAETRWMVQAGRLRPGGKLFQQMKLGLDRVRRPRTDLPFGEFLDGPARSRLSGRARQLARTLVEGFDAADASRASTFATLKEWSGAAAADAPTFRPLGGYGQLLGSLAGACDQDKGHLKLGTIVKAVRWQRGHVSMAATVHGQSASYSASRAIITVPLGVLQLPAQSPHAIRFEPDLRTKRRAFEGLAVGPVIKVILRFRKAFWEELDAGRYRDAAFFHSPNSLFPTAWTALPMRAPVLAVWSAGPNASELSGLEASQIVQRALASLEVIFGRRAGCREQLQSVHFHNWQTDPFACGAYSYVTVGGSAARQLLARSLQDTLFFAGEATDEDASGTVSGALESGERAARQAMGVGSSPSRS